VIYAIGDSDKVHTFVERFVEDVSRAGTLRVTNAVENNHHFAALDGAALVKLRHDHPADAYLGVNVFTCSGIDRSAEGSERDVDGIGRPTTRAFRLAPGIAYERKRRWANGRASRFARPRWASASVSAAGMPRRRAARTIGPATKPPPPKTTSGRRRRRIARQARGARPAR